MKMASVAPFQIVFLGLTMFLVDSATLPRNEVEALSAFKRAISDDPFHVLSNWNPLESNACGWFGVSCSTPANSVIKLNISGMNLKGFLAPELSQLSALQELILHGNCLIGSIPNNISLLQQLKVLDLGSNQLVGAIPPEIGNLSSILKINLESNGLTGKLPPELGNLKYLQELLIDRNKLHGTLLANNGPNYTSYSHGSTIMTGLCRLPKLKTADFSYNFFVGTVPKCLEYIPGSYFRSNCLQVRGVKQRSSEQCGIASPAKGVNTNSMPEKKHEPSSSKPKWRIALEFVIGVMIVVLVVVAVLTSVHKWRRKPSIIIPWRKSSTSTDDIMMNYIDPELLKDVRRYRRQELEAACEDFSNIIGSFPDSMVYKGTFKRGPEIAAVSVCMKEERWSGYLEVYFQKEVADLARLDHENVGKLLGYCRERNPFTRMLVLEYASNGTLYEHLHYGEACELSWTRRMKVILGIARGLKYLHTELDPPFSISELNSSSIYLTDDLSPKLIDFDCWKTIISRSKMSSDSISNEGAVCILASSLEGRHHDIQGNIYAFGILLLEIVSGRPPYSQDSGCLVDWARGMLELPEAISYIVDPELKHFRYEDLKVICEVVRKCIRSGNREMAAMTELCSMLEAGIDTSVTAEIRASCSLAWAELALSA